MKVKKVNVWESGSFGASHLANMVIINVLKRCSRTRLILTSPR